MYKTKKGRIRFMKGVILCGGLATRFLPITKSVPKEMLPILNKPALDYIVRDMIDNGIKNILIILGRGKECIENYYDRNIELEDRLAESQKYDLLEQLKKIYSDVNITFIRQIYARGTGYAVSLAKNFVGEEPFVLSYPDELIIGQSFTQQLLQEFEKTGSNILPLRQVPLADCVKYGMVALSQENDRLNINKIVEKPSIDNSPSDISYTGGGIFKSNIFDAISTCNMHSNGEIYLTDAFDKLISNNDLCGKLVVGERIDFGNPLGFVKGNIIAGLQSEEYRQELLEFMQNILDKNK